MECVGPSSMNNAANADDNSCGWAILVELDGRNAQASLRSPTEPINKRKMKSGLQVWGRAVDICRPVQSEELGGSVLHSRLCFVLQLVVWSDLEAVCLVKTPVLRIGEVEVRLLGWTVGISPTTQKKPHEANPAASLGKGAREERCGTKMMP